MASKNVVSITKKYTVPSTGIWERIRRVLAVDPNRSTGVPLNPQFRNPPPGALAPESYDDPVTLPAADIADNPYWKRDVRRGYPKLSVVRQADVAGLLTVGSAANPKDGVLQVGEAGQKQLVQVQQDGEENGLAALFEKDKKSIGSVLNPAGLPPMPTPMHPGPSVRQYVMKEEQTYENQTSASHEALFAHLGHPRTHPKMANMETTSQGKIFCENFRDTMNLIHQITVSQPSDSGDSQSRQSSPTNPILLKYTDSIPFDDHWLYPCAICYKTIPEIYQDSRNHHGLTQDYYEANKHQIMRLWLTQCGHLVCGAHFQDGGVPFHAQNQLPRAACPVCIDMTGEFVGLWWVLDITSGKYHRDIPKNYFAIPAQDEVTYMNQLTGISRVLFATKEKLAKAETERDSVVDNNFNLYRMQLKVTEELKVRYNSLKSQNAKLLEGKLALEGPEKREEHIKFLLKEARDIFHDNELMARSLRKYGEVPNLTRPSLSSLRRPSNEGIEESGSEADFLDEEVVNLKRSQQAKRLGGPAGTGSAPRSSAVEVAARVPSRELMPPPPRPTVVTSRGGTQTLQPNLFASQEVSSSLPGAPRTGLGTSQTRPFRLDPTSAPFVPASQLRALPTTNPSIESPRDQMASDQGPSGRMSSDGRRKARR